MNLHAVHQFHAGSAAGDGVTNGMLLTRSILRDLGLESEIYALQVAPELAGDVLPHTRHRGAGPAAGELLIVHHSMGHDAADWVASVRCGKILAYHNITPAELLVDQDMRRYSTLGRKQLVAWGAGQRSGQGRPFLGALADSSYNAVELRDLGFGQADDPLTVLPLLIDVDSRVAASAGAPREYRHDGGTPPPAAQLLFVGRLIEHKRQRDIISLLPQLRRRLSRDVRLTLVGGGEPGYVDSLRSLAADLGVADAVSITGKVTDLELAMHYRTADLFVCLSEHEGFCIPLVEAAVHGVPVLAYDRGAVAETMGEGGLLLATREPEVVAAAATLLLEAPDLRRRVVERQVANLRRFSRVALRDQLLRFFSDLQLTLPSACTPAACAPTRPRSSTYRIEGPFTSSYSLALVNRELGLALSRMGERVELRSMEGEDGDFDPDHSFLQSHPEVAAIAASPTAPGTVAAPAQVVLRNMYPPRADGIRSLGVRGLACYAWEETGFPRHYARAMNRSLDIVTVTSSHVQRILQDSGVHVPIAVVGNGTDHLERVRGTADASQAESWLAGRAPGFRFLHVSSAFPRKGVDVLLEAWTKLGAVLDRPASLVIKTFPNPHSRLRDDVAALRRSHPGVSPIVVLDEDVDGATLRSLYGACDAFVAPSRAEGFGLPLAEAMLAGRPVITTAWGGQSDFCTDRTAWLVDWRYAEARTHLDIPSSVWAEPDLGALVEQMRRVATATEEEKAPRVEAARALLRSRHRWDDVAMRLREAVAQVEAAPVMRVPRVCLVTTWGSRCGIASYARALAGSIPEGYLSVLANTDAELIEPDGPEVQRCWRTGLEDDLEDLEAALTSSEASTVVFQFNFGFFKIHRLGGLLERLVDQGRAVHVVLHSTADVDRPDLKISLRDASTSLARATRLVVHSVTDMNRLREFGLSANVTLFPHGVPNAVVPIAPRRQGAAAAAASAAVLQTRRQGRRVVATFGYLLPHKGLREMIAALSPLHRLAEAAGAAAPHLLMLNALYPAASSQEEREACRRLINDEGLWHCVTFVTDFLTEDDALSLLSLADVVVYPYQQTQESSSAAVRLGLASLRPVAVTPLAIFRDVAPVTHCLPGTRPADIAAGLWELLADRSVPSGATASRQVRWVEEHAWTSVSERFWGMVRALDPGKRHREEGRELRNLDAAVAA
jgi:glycosyltransferase involved in cell wall biosynthesis